MRCMTWSALSARPYPPAAREFTLRVTGGGAGRAGNVAYERTEIHKIVDGVRIEGGMGLGGKAERCS